MLTSHYEKKLESFRRSELQQFKNDKVFGTLSAKSWKTVLFSLL